jgi:glutathione synthase/RimK-type ligase-like ATP-grasp enzyme
MKPVTGSRGRNIIKVTKADGRGFQYQYQMNNRMYEGMASTLAGLRKSLRRVMGSQTYIVQERINLLQYEGNILDVRVMTQKDNKGSFSITGKACRIGKPGSITSNISAGGQGQKVEFILNRQFSQSAQRERIINEINMVALESAKLLDEVIGSIGELGIDIGIDRDGKVWFIEANLRPARQVFLLIGEKALRKDSVTKPLLYCRYLAGFKEQ